MKRDLFLVYLNGFCLCVWLAFAYRDLHALYALPGLSHDLAGIAVAALTLLAAFAVSKSRGHNILKFSAFVLLAAFLVGSLFSRTTFMNCAAGYAIDCFFGILCLLRARAAFHGEDYDA